MLPSLSAVVQTSTADYYDAYVLRNYARAPATLVRGAGVSVWDDAGKQYLDFTSGIAVTTLGHCHPAWVEAVRRQAGELVHVSNLFRNPQQGQLAARLVRRAGPGRVFFCNSGAEANEALIKLARLHGRALSGGEEGRRFKIVCANNAFHGRTFGGMSATPQEKVQKGFRPLVPGFVFAEFNDLESFSRAIDDTTAAVLLETIQGEGGIVPASPEFLTGLRRLCTERNVLLLLDEVQCGLGRTGRFFAYEESGIVPDAIGMAKGLGGGFPIGAIWVRETAAELFTPGCHGSTFGGTPLGCAAALAVLDVIEREGLLEQITRLSGPWRAQLESLARDYPKLVRSVRGSGYMIGLQMHDDPAGLVAEIREAGLLVPAAGGNTIRLLPPLIATAQDLEQSLSILRSVLDKHA